MYSSWQSASAQAAVRRGGTAPRTWTTFPRTLRTGLGACRRRRIHKDPILAQGISVAFRDAELLANAIDDGLAGQTPLNEALRNYEQRRNDVALPGYEQNCDAGSLVLPPEEMMAQRAATHVAQRSVP